MSFLSLNNYSHFNYKQIERQRKEKDSSLAYHVSIHSSPIKERASSFTSQGSITVEAAFSVSFFFLAAICLVYLLEMMAIQTAIKNALHLVAKEYAVESYLHPSISIEEMEQDVVSYIGAERLERSMIVNGSRGLDLSESKRYWDTTIMEITAKYRMELPIMLFRFQTPCQKQSVRIKGWTGYEFILPRLEGEQMVYVTDYGVVYHLDRTCTYLDLSVSSVSKGVLEELRNQGGSKYKACLLCGALESEAQVYITDYGERYHSSLECSGLKRYVYEIPLSDVQGLGGCSKCVN